MDKLKRVLQGRDEEDEETGFVTQALDASSLSYSTRMKGFGISFGIGILLALLGCLILMFNPFNVTGFSVLYTLGNICAISSTCFLMGPLKQIKNMFAPTRIIATVVMFLSLVLVLMSAFWWKKPVLSFIFCIIEFFAFTWYGISYIPFARDAIIKCFDGMF